MLASNLTGAYLRNAIAKSPTVMASGALRSAAISPLANYAMATHPEIAADVQRSLKSSR
ncbi:MAG: hypothetical protein ACQETE_09740 [Bacteroidota bacterium]